MELFSFKETMIVVEFLDLPEQEPFLPQQVEM